MNDTKEIKRAELFTQRQNNASTIRSKSSFYVKIASKAICLLIAVSFMTACNVDARLAKADELYKEGIYFKVEKQYLQTVGMIPNSRKALPCLCHRKEAENTPNRKW